MKQSAVFGFCGFSVLLQDPYFDVDFRNLCQPLQGHCWKNSTLYNNNTLPYVQRNGRYLDDYDVD